MSKFDSSFIQTNKRFSSYSTKAVYPYEEDNDEDKWIMQHISVNDAEIFNHTIQAITFNCDPQCPSLAPIESYYIQKKHSNAWDIFVKMPRMKWTLKEKIDKLKKTNTYPTEIELIFCLYSLVKCLEYLEERNTMHNNIKPTNILFDENECAFLSDGKMLKLHNGEFADNFVSRESPLFYTQPMILANEQANDINKRDVWSLGIVMLEFCLCDIKIKSSFNSNEEVRNMFDCQIRKLKDRYSKQFIEIIAGLLDVDLNQRRTFKDTRVLIENQFVYVKEEYDRRKTIKPIKSPTQTKQKKNRDNKAKKPVLTQKSLKLMGFLGMIFAIFLYYIIRIYNIQPKILNPPQSNLEFNNISSDLEQDTIIIYEFESPFEKEDDVEDQSLNNDNCDNFNVQNTDSNYDTSNSESAFAEYQFEIERSLMDISDDKNKNINQNSRLEESESDNEEANFRQSSSSSNDNLPENGGNWKDYFQLTHEADAFEITSSRVFEIDDTVLNNLVNDLQSMLLNEQFQNLKNFTLFLWKCEKITDSGIRLLENLFPNDAFSLKSLTLGFNSLKLITDEGVKSVALHVLKYQTSLESLALDFFNCPEITDQGILRLSSSISKFQSGLKRLSLIFSRCTQITDKGLGYATLQALISLKDLQFLSISFGRTSISDRGLKQLGSDLSKYGQNLTDLEIKIYGCEHISDKGFKSLILDIAENLKQLGHLQLSLWETAVSSKAQQFAKKHLEFIPDLDIST